MLKPIRVLIVDDDSNVRRGLRMRLRLDPGIVVIGEAGDGREGVRQAVELRPDLVLLDLNLPLLDGFAACRLIHANGIAVVVLSLEDAERVQERCLEAGASTFVSKQEPTRVLLAAIRAAVDSRSDRTLADR